MNTYTFKAHNMLTIEADVEVEASSLEEAMGKLAMLDPGGFTWEVSDWSSAVIGACIDEVVIDSEDTSETTELIWLTDDGGEFDWWFRARKCVVGSSGITEEA